MNKIYEKNELNFALIWIGIYVVSLSVADSISASLGIEKIVTAPLCIVLTAIMYFWIRKNGLKEKYGLCKFQGNLKQYLYFIPLVIIASTNVWWGVKLNVTVLETVFYIISMLCVGFLEEVIFRGFLFKALCKDNLKTAIIISSVTFGFGHIVNLLNGKELVTTLVQICYAVAVGFGFTILFYKGKSLWPCIITHSVVNSLSAVANKEARAGFGDILGPVVLFVVPLIYGGYILYTERKNTKNAVSSRYR